MAPAALLLKRICSCRNWITQNPPEMDVISIDAIKDTISELCGLIKTPPTSEKSLTDFYWIWTIFYYNSSYLIAGGRYSKLFFI